MKVFLIHDAAGTPTVLRRALEQSGHEIVEAANCHDAAQKLLNNIPDIIVSTSRISDSDRSMLANGIKKDLAAKEIPIISCAMNPDGAEGLDLVINIKTTGGGKVTAEPDKAWTEAVAILARLNTPCLEKGLTTTKAELSLLQNLFLRISAAEDLNNALTTTLEAFCGFGPCVYAEAWLPTPQGLTLEAYSECADKNHAAKELIELGKGLTLKPGAGLPGRVFISREPMIIRDITTEGSTTYAARPPWRQASIRSYALLY